MTEQNPNDIVCSVCGNQNYQEPPKGESPICLTCGYVTVPTTRSQYKESSMITLTAQGITINLTTYKHVARFISDIESRVMLHELESIGKDVRACDAYSINGNMKDNRRSNNLFAYWDGGNEVVVIHEGEEVFMVGIDDRELNRFIEEDDDIFDELEDRIIERFKAL